LDFYVLYSTAEFRKGGDHKVPDLMVFGVAGDQEHVSGDSLVKHLLPGDAIAA